MPDENDQLTRDDFHHFDPVGHKNPAADAAALCGVLEEYGRIIGRSPQVVELGAWVGATSINLALRGCIVYAVDHWHGSPNDRLGEIAEYITQDKLYTTFCRNCGPFLYDRIFPVVGDTREVAGWWPCQVDAVYVDAGHSFVEAASDIVCWMPHIRDGGLMLGHDFGFFHGVTLAAITLGNVVPFGLTSWGHRKTGNTSTSQLYMDLQQSAENQGEGGGS